MPTLTQRFVTGLLLIAGLLILDSAALYAQPLPKESARFDEITVFKLKVDSRSGYRLYYGPNKGELILDVTRPPKGFMKQLETYLGDNLLSIKILSRSASRLKLKLIISPPVFRFKHERSVAPHAIIIRIGHKLLPGESAEEKKQRCYQRLYTGFLQLTKLFHMNQSYNDIPRELF